MAEGISGLSTSFQVSRITVPNLCIALRQYNTSTMRIESLLYFVRERVRKMERESVPDHWAEILLHESYPNEMSLLGSVLIPFQDCELLRTAASHYQFCGPTRTRMENAGIRPVSQILNQAVHLEVCSMNLNPAQKEIREEIQGWVEGWIQSDLIVPTRNFILLFHGPSRRQSISSSPLSSLYTLASGEGYISRQGSSPSLHGQSPQHLSNALPQCNFMMRRWIHMVRPYPCHRCRNNKGLRSQGLHRIPEPRSMTSQYDGTRERGR